MTDRETFRLFLSRNFLEKRVSLLLPIPTARLIITVAVAALKESLLHPMFGREAVDNLLQARKDHDERDEGGANDAVETGNLAKDRDLEGEGEHDAAGLLHERGLRGLQQLGRL